MKRHPPVKAARQSARLRKEMVGDKSKGKIIYRKEEDFMAGMEESNYNPFIVLDLVDEDDLNILTEDYDIVLGASSGERNETLYEM